MWWPGILLTIFLTVAGERFQVTEGRQYFVSPGVTLVSNWEGWGTSMAWWPDVLGAMPQDVIDTVNAAFFSSNSLNFNILRYTIGGTTPGDYKCGPYRPGGATESFLDGPDHEYDWTRDPRQRGILQAAKNFGVDTFEAFSNSPPQWMTISGCSKGNDGAGPLHNNFDVVNATAFADYATEVIRHFHDAWNITFQSYAPFNEPSGLNGNGYWTGTKQNQEGCSMTLPVMSAVVQAMTAAIEEKEMNYVSLTISDETQINQALVTQQHFYDEGLSHLATKLNVHGYSDSGNDQRRDLLYMRANRDGHRLWMDEMGWSEGAGGDDMAQGLNVANRIVTDIRGMLPSAWVYWQAMEDYGAWGLLSLPYGDPSVPKIKYNSGFYALMQFSKYIKKGFTIVHISNNHAVAALDPTTNNLVMVIVNPSEEATSSDTYDLGLFSKPADITATRTSQFEKNEQISAPAYNELEKSFDYSAPPRSITTFVIESASSIAEAETLLQNGDFENGAEGWYLEQAVVDASYAFRGQSGAVLGPTNGMAVVGQTFSIPKEDDDDRSLKNYYLTTWLKSSGADDVLTSLNVAVFAGGNSDNVTNFYDQHYGPDVGYGSFGLQFEAAPGDRVNLSISVEKALMSTYVDELTIFRN